MVVFNQHLLIQRILHLFWLIQSLNLQKITTLILTLMHIPQCLMLMHLKHKLIKQ